MFAFAHTIKMLWNTSLTTPEADSWGMGLCFSLLPDADTLIVLHSFGLTQSQAVCGVCMVS